LRAFVLWLERVVFGIRERCVKLVDHSLTRKKRYLAVFLIIVAIMGFFWLRMPKSYLPDEDQGILLAQLIMPTGSTLEQTEHIAKQVEHYLMKNEKDAVESAMTLTGIGFSGRSQ